MATAAQRGKKVYTGRTVDAYFDMDYTGIARYAVQSNNLADALEDLADAGLAYAESISPRSGDDDEDVPYADSWQVDRYIETRVGIPPFPRGAFTLANTSPHATLVEFGNGTAADDGHRIFPKVIDYLRLYGRGR